MKMLPELEGRSVHEEGNDEQFVDDLDEIGMLLSEQPSRQDVNDREKELKMFRSGSAPPTVEGSLTAVGGLFGQQGRDWLPGFVGSGNQSENGFFSEEELRSDPEYLSYYYSNVNLNPRLPPPLFTKEDSRYAHRLKAGNSVLGGIGDRRKLNNGEDSGDRSILVMPPGFNSLKEADTKSNNMNASGLGLGSKQKSIADLLRDDFRHQNTASENLSRPASRNNFDENNVAPTPVEAEDELAQLRRSSVVLNTGQSNSFTYAAVVGSSLSRNASPDPQLIARAPSPSITPIGSGRAEKRSVNSPNSFHGMSSTVNESAGLVAKLSGLGLSSNGKLDDEHSYEQDVRTHRSHAYSHNHNGRTSSLSQRSYLTSPESPVLDTLHGAEAIFSDTGKNNGNQRHSPSFLADGQVNVNKSAGNYLNSNLQRSASGYDGGSISPSYHNFENTTTFSKNHGSSGYNLDPTLATLMASQRCNHNLPPLYDNFAAAAAMGHPGMHLSGLGGGLDPLLQSQNHNLSANNIAIRAAQLPYADPLYLQYLRAAEYSAAAQFAALHGQSLDKNYGGNRYMDMLGTPNAYMSGLLSHQKTPRSNKLRNSNHGGYYGKPAFDLSYPGSPLASPIMQNSPLGPGSPIGRNDLKMCFHSGTRNSSSGYMQSWDAHSVGSFPSSLLDEFKSNRTKSFELSEIAGHLVEFSVDQYGSRFIQQKLETATIEEKNIVFEEIFPEALRLMTDVFGNYVLQKLFEHGMPDQRCELANKLYSNVLSLSLQMYGCRVIQKAIEVVDLDQKIKMVQELDGQVMRCVRDQNGNHVIQKCIECVPEESIHFIISTFYDQIVTLSTHPYGCRVVQRVLEYCHNEETQKKVMEEILGSVSMLAQDQYGNYVIQHVLEHGKQHERSVIIQELSGRIVLMSQQKFASNVVEKCLTYSNPSERQFLISEMLGTNDENEPLQAMMKDQYANYVVQKVLETCDDQQRELIMTRIKVHLTALKKYTYGKHIVARVEKLVSAGERRMALQSSNPNSA